MLRKNTHLVVGAWSFLLVHTRLSPTEGPKGFVHLFLRNETMEGGPWSQTMEKGHMPWSNFMVHDVNQP